VEVAQVFYQPDVLPVTQPCQSTEENTNQKHWESTYLR